MMRIVVCVGLVGLGIGLRAGAAASLTNEAKATLTTFLRQSVTRGDVPGVVALVVTKDQVIYQGAVGQRDVARAVPMTPDTIFRIASMTKPLTTALAMMLVEEGRVHLDDTVATYIPRFAAATILVKADEARGTLDTRPAKAAMTIRHLLTHTSGIGYSWSDPGLAAAQRITKAANDTELPLVHEPGEKWTYGGSTRVLGDIVQIVTEQPFGQVLASRLLQPLGMVDTAFDVPAASRDRVATVHQRTAGRLVEARNPESLTVVARGDGGLYCTAADYARYMQMILNRGQLNGRRFLTDTTVAQMTRNQVGAIRVRQQPSADAARSRPFPTGVGQDTWGFGFQIAAPTKGNEPARRPGSVTWAGIDNTHFFIDPSTGIGVVVMMQVLPFYDEAAMGVLHGFETRLYRALQ
jgi:CubicO group peptidase (beta-lactamase class C family)